MKEDKENSLRHFHNIQEALYKCREENKRLKCILDEVSKLVPKFDDTQGCAYGDFDCENCSDINKKFVCTYKLKKIILDTISKAEIRI